MRKKLSLLLICCTITTYSQVQKEWIIGNNRINFDSAPPTVSYFNTNLFTATSIETNSTSKSIYVDYNANPYIANDFQAINHSNTTSYGSLGAYGFTFRNKKKAAILKYPNESKYMLFTMAGDYYANINTGIYNYFQKTNGISLDDNFSTSHIDSTNYSANTFFGNTDSPYATFAYGKNFQNGYDILSIIDINDTWSPPTLKISTYKLTSAGLLLLNTINLNIDQEIKNYLDLYTVNSDFTNDFSPYIIAKFDNNLNKLGILVIANSKLNSGIEDFHENSNTSSWFLTVDYNDSSDTFSNLQSHNINIGGSFFVRDFEFSKDGNLLYAICSNNRRPIFGTSHKRVLSVTDLTSNQSINIPKTGLNKIGRDPNLNLILFDRKESKFLKVNNENDILNLQLVDLFTLTYIDSYIENGNFVLPQSFPDNNLSPTGSYNVTQVSNVYPNPNSGLFNIESKTIPQNIKVFDSNSNLILEKQNIMEYTNKINIEEQKKGYYFIVITYSDKSQERITIQKK